MMSYLLEALARGWPGTLSKAFGRRLAEATLDSPGAPPPGPNRAAQLASSAQRGLRALRDGEWGTARTLLAEAAVSCPAEPIIHLSLACCFDELGLIDQACSALATAANLQPQDASVQLGLGYCHERQGR